MPDWSYQTLLRPLLFSLPPTVARDLSLSLIGQLAQTPLGPAAIDFLGHMRPDTRLQRTLMGIRFPTTVGLGPSLDEKGVATKALARFGVGFIEIGPVIREPDPSSPHIHRLDDQDTIWLSGLAGVPVRTAVNYLNANGPLPVPLLARLGCPSNPSIPTSTDDCQSLIEQLRPYVSAFSLTTLAVALASQWSLEQWRAYISAILCILSQSAPSPPLILCIPPNLALPEMDLWITTTLSEGVAGFIVDSAQPTAPTGFVVGRATRESALQQVKWLRERLGPDPVIIGAGGIHEPVDALRFMTAGADLVQVDSGLVFSGPGLPKRINDMLLYAQENTSQVSPTSPTPPAPRLSWFWTAMMGLGMFGGGLLAFIIAATRVILPYDEALVDLTRHQLIQINPHLLAFMAHDRISLSGTMVSIGIIYLYLSWYGLRQGLHWARVTVLTSASIGFAAFFLFLGFGYFDPFHAFVTAILCQFLLLALYAHEVSPAQPPPQPNLVNDRAWRLSLWGQLMFVGHGLALMGAGAVIAFIGATSVFVPEDLAFMQTTAETLHATSHRLVPLIAHDRATFGGLLIANGVAVLMVALWGYRQGYRWLWWMLLGAGVAAYSAAIGVHLSVGYTDVWHLGPSLAGLLLFLLGLGLSFPYLYPTHRWGITPAAPYDRQTRRSAEAGPPPAASPLARAAPDARDV